jgi:hypothetical protein
MKNCLYEAVIGKILQDCGCLPNFAMGRDGSKGLFSWFLPLLCEKSWFVFHQININSRSIKRPSLFNKFIWIVAVCRGKRLTCAMDVMDYFGNYPDPDLTRFKYISDSQFLLCGPPKVCETSSNSPRIPIKIKILSLAEQ